MSSTAQTLPATVEPPPTPQVIHSCPVCSHWLPDGTLACPDCTALTYGAYLNALATQAQALERENKWTEARSLWQTALTWMPADAAQAGSVREHLTAIEARLAAEADKKAKWKKRLGPFAPVLVFLAKIKTWFFLLFKLKFLFSLLAYFAIYWALGGWRFAVLFTVSVAFHEFGHYVAVKRRGLKADLPVFLPGFGAYVKWYAAGVSREDIAAISLAGPLFGLIAAVVCWLASLAMHGQGQMAVSLLIVANLGAWYNILNLTPVMGLDGAKALLALSKLQRWLVAATCGVLFWVMSAPDPWDYAQPRNHYVFLIVGAGVAWQATKRDSPDEPHSSTLTYFLAVLLALGFLLQVTPMPALQ
jgi:Zn-dependent protease